MTAKEANWAFENEVMVSLEIDPIQKKRAWYQCIEEIGKRKDRNKKIYFVATCRARIGNSVHVTPVEYVEFAKKEDEERCHRELDIQSTAVS